MLSVQYDFSPRELDSVHEMGTATQLGLIESGGGRAQGGRGLSTQLNGQQTQDSSPSKHLELGQAPPIFARFATTSPATKPPTLVAIIPRPPKLHPIPTSETPTPTSTPKRRPRRLSLMQRAPSPTIVTTPSPDTGPHAPIEGDQPSDGPLFRALIGSLERRAQSLRASTKTLVKSLEGSLSALQANQSAQASVDDALEGLSIASSGTLKSEVLGGLYAELLGPQRGLATQSRQLEIDHLEELLTRLRNSGERLKLQDQRRKDFESASKRYYDEISKVSPNPSLRIPTQPAWLTRTPPSAVPLSRRRRTVKDRLTRLEASNPRRRVQRSEDRLLRLARGPSGGRGGRSGELAQELGRRAGLDRGRGHV